MSILAVSTIHTVQDLCKRGGCLAIKHLIAVCTDIVSNLVIDIRLSLAKYICSCRQYKWLHKWYHLLKTWFRSDSKLQWIETGLVNRLDENTYWSLCACHIMMHRCIKVATKLNVRWHVSACSPWNQGASNSILVSCPDPTLVERKRGLVTIRHPARP